MEWAGNSLDFNPVEHIGVILTERAEGKMIQEHVTCKRKARETSARRAIGS